MVQVYGNPQKFWTEVAPHLRQEEAKNSLCLGLANIFATKNENCRYQSALFDGSGQLVGALMCSQYQTNVNFLPTPVQSAEHAEALFVEFQNAGIRPNGIVGELSAVNAYRKFFGQTKVNMTQGIYRCTQVVMPKMAADHHFRPAEMADVPQVGEWIELFVNEALPHDPPLVGLKVATEKIKAGAVFLLEENGHPVSMAATARDIGTSCSINMVFTPKEFRGRGFASLATALLTDRELKSGKRETNLYTDMSNPTSNKIYQKVGYEFVCDSLHLGVL